MAIFNMQLGVIPYFYILLHTFTMCIRISGMTIGGISNVWFETAGASSGSSARMERTCTGLGWCRRLDECGTKSTRVNGEVPELVDMDDFHNMDRIETVQIIWSKKIKVMTHIDPWSVEIIGYLEGIPPKWRTEIGHSKDFLGSPVHPNVEVSIW